MIDKLDLPNSQEILSAPDSRRLGKGRRERGERKSGGLERVVRRGRREVRGEESGL